jgi:tetraacyldisaccharide 4'-kinase
VEKQQKVNKILYPLSLLYGILYRADKSFTKAKKLNAPVISVGNLTWGGSGKTPIVIEILKLASEYAKKTAVLTRGYGREGKKPFLLREGVNPNIKDCGDEALLIFKSVLQTNVIIGSDRFNNALRFEKEINPDIYILDDGFQHWKIKRDLDIVCINGLNPFGNGLLIPAGILRENISALKRANLIVITNADKAGEEQISYIKNKINPFIKEEPIITHYGGHKIKQLNLTDDFDIEKLKNNPIYSLSAIGFSDGFKNSLEKVGIKTIDSFKFKDHFIFTKKIIENILHKTKNSFLIVTAKDAVKIEAIADDNIKERIAVLTVKPIFDKGEKLWKEKILNILQYS